MATAAADVALQRGSDYQACGRGAAGIRRSTSAGQQGAPLPGPTGEGSAGLGAVHRRFAVVGIQSAAHHRPIQQLRVMGIETMWKGWVFRFSGLWLALFMW